ncbi:hypothetical protein TRFO_17480 [Tritrichomonas foetus]|uniref:Ubiquitin-like domain-containing protein n=1 Tax=Tritrichomonas foetus TaxID=1144522 RepID=A0A1J4KS57_9EUKA|nr:hypothetical protein TRFO_17480 [Tritrichomonas foetus]|eukprot:OHT12652.1 hypothetical protein TRFO_17480 [Tritrichomonas foetus]
MSIYKFILPSGSIYEHEFKSSTTFRSAKIALRQSKRVVGTLETIKLIANHQYVLDSTKLEILTRCTNKCIYVEHNGKSYAVNIRFLKDNNKSISMLFAKNETIYDIKSHLASNYYYSETNGDPNKIQLAKGITTFSNDADVEGMNIKKHDCLIVTIGETESPQKTLLGNEFLSPTSSRNLNVTYNPKKTPKHKILANEFMYCQPIRASFPVQEHSPRPDCETNAQMSKPRTKKPKIPNLRYNQQNGSREKPRNQRKKISPREKVSPRENEIPSPKSKNTNSPRSQNSQGMMVKANTIGRVSSKDRMTITDMIAENYENGDNPEKSQNMTISNPNDEIVDAANEENLIDNNNEDINENDNVDDNVDEGDVCDDDDENEESGHLFNFDDGEEDENNDVLENGSMIKLPLPFQLPNGTVQSVMLSINDTVGDCKTKFAEICNCDRDNIVLKLKGNELKDENTQVMSISEYHGTTPIMIIVHVNETRPGDGKVQYFFRISDVNLCPFYFEENATVGDAKKAVAAELKKEPKDITLIYNCKNLTDKILLRKLRIPIDGCIIVLIEDHSSIRIKTPLTAMKPRKPFKITFLTTDQQKFDYNVPPLDTVADIKSAFEKKLSCQADQIDLIFGGKLLTDDLIFDGLGVHDGSKIVINMIRPSTANLSRSLKSGTLSTLTSSTTEEIEENEDVDSWEDELFQMISAKELIRLQALPPKEMSDAQKIIIYLRCNRDMQTTRRTLKSSKV